MQHGALDDDYSVLSEELYSKLCGAGFTRERVQLQAHLSDHLEELYKDLYDNDLYTWFIAGSYGDVWGNNLFALDGQTDESESDIDWTCLMNKSTFHFEGSFCRCNITDQKYVLSTDRINEGHIQCSFEYLREPAEPHKKIGIRPKIDECTAYPCCYIPDALLRPGVESFGFQSAIAESIQLIQASRPGFESLELRFSFAKVEKYYMRRLSTIQGHLFLLIKYSMLHKFNIDIFAFKSYHAKTLLFFVIERLKREPDTVWRVKNLVKFLKLSFDILVEFMTQCSSVSSEKPGFHAAMKSFFLKDCYIYFHKKIFSDQPHKLLINAIQNTKNSIVSHVKEYMKLLRPQSESGLIFHAYTLFPIRLTFQFQSKPKNADNLYWQMHNCLQELTVLQIEKKTAFIRHVESLPPSAFTASLCLKVMTHLKFGARDDAVELLTKHRYHEAQHHVAYRDVDREGVSVELNNELNTKDTAWCFAFTYDQLKPLDFSFLGEAEIYDKCILRSATYPVDVVIDFDCLSRVFYQLLCNDRTKLQKWKDDLVSKRASLCEIYLYHKFITPIIDNKVLDALNQSIINGARDRVFFAKLVKSFGLTDENAANTFCKWMDSNMQSAHFLCLYSVSKVPQALLQSTDSCLLLRALERAEHLTANSLPYQDYEMLLAMRRRLGRVYPSYLETWNKRVSNMKLFGKLNVHEIFAFIKAANELRSYSNLSFGLSTLRESPKALSYLKLKDFRLLAEVQKTCVSLEYGYLDVWLSDLQTRLDGLPEDRAPFIIIELVSLTGSLSSKNVACIQKCRELLKQLASKTLSKTDTAKVNRLQFFMEHLT